MIRTGLGIALMVAAAASALADSPVPVHEEPRHRLVHEGAGFRVLDVQIPPGDTTSFHTHDAPIAYVSIGRSPTNAQPLGGSWGTTGPDDPPGFEPNEIDWDLTYAATPLTHRVTNVGKDLFRLVAIVSYGSGETAPSAGPLLAGVPAEAESRWFRRGHVAMEPGQRIEVATKARALIAVMQARGRVEATGGKVLGGPGAFAVFTGESPGTLTNASGQPVLLALVEVR